MVEGESTDEIHIQASNKLLEAFPAENPEFLLTQVGPQKLSESCSQSELSAIA